jgi:hypothetical protein
VKVAMLSRSSFFPNRFLVGPHRLENYFVKMGLLAVLFTIIGCNAMNPNMMNSNRMLMSMTVAPAMANGGNSMNGQVQFSATGTFSQPPSPAPVTFIAPFSGGWSVSNMDIATINQNGMAQCMHTGMVTVTAQASSNSTSMPGAMSSMGSMSTVVTANATLTCP